MPENVQLGDLHTVIKVSQLKNEQALLHFAKLTGRYFGDQIVPIQPLSAEPCQTRAPAPLLAKLSPEELASCKEQLKPFREGHREHREHRPPSDLLQRMHENQLIMMQALGQLLERQENLEKNLCAVNSQLQHAFKQRQILFKMLKNSHVTQIPDLKEYQFETVDELLGMTRDSRGEDQQTNLEFR